METADPSVAEALEEHRARVDWCGVPSGDGFRARCSCGWLSVPTPIKAVATVDAANHQAGVAA